LGSAIEPEIIWAKGGWAQGKSEGIGLSAAHLFQGLFFLELEQIGRAAFGQGPNVEAALGRGDGPTTPNAFAFTVTLISHGVCRVNFLPATFHGARIVKAGDGECVDSVSAITLDFASVKTET
jgi:hypothetical protein